MVQESGLLGDPNRLLGEEMSLGQKSAYFGGING